MSSHKTGHLFSAPLCVPQVCAAVGLAVAMEEERRLAEFNAGSQAVQDVLSGAGYLERDTDPSAKLIPDEYAAVKGRKVSPESDTKLSTVSA